MTEPVGQGLVHSSAECCRHSPDHQSSTTDGDGHGRRASVGAFAHAQMPKGMRPKYPWQRGFFYGPPLSWIYFLYVLLSTAVLMPYWLVKYTPRTHRPRPTWSLKMSIFVRAQRRLQLILKHCKTALISTDPSKEVDSSSLQHARFEWIPPVPRERLYGVCDYPEVKAVKIPAYVYPKDAICSQKHLDHLKGAEKVDAGESGCPVKEKLVALFFHGGGYFVLSAHPKHSPAAISNALADIPEVSAVYALDYRLSSHTPFPAQLIDALSAYHHLVHTLGIPEHRIVLVGDSAGGNLALALARYLRDPPPNAYVPPSANTAGPRAPSLLDRGLTPLRPPHAIFLLSPWCDAAWDVPVRPPGFKLQNEDVDYLNKDALAPLQRAALAGHREGDDAVALWQSVWMSPGWKGLRYPLNIINANASLSSVGLVPTLGSLKASNQHVSAPGSGVGASGQEVLNDDVARRRGSDAAGILNAMRRKSLKLVPEKVNISDVNDDDDDDDVSREIHPKQLVPLFRGMPRNVFVGYGGAEALVEEIGRLKERLTAAGTKVTMYEIQDAVHDCLILGWWDAEVKAKFWRDARPWWTDMYAKSLEITKSGVSVRTDLETGRMMAERLMRPRPFRMTSNLSMATTASDPSQFV